MDAVFPAHMCMKRWALLASCLPLPPHSPLCLYHLCVLPAMCASCRMPLASALGACWRRSSTTESGSRVSTGCMACLDATLPPELSCGVADYAPGAFLSPVHKQDSELKFYSRSLKIVPDGKVCVCLQRRGSNQGPRRFFFVWTTSPCVLPLRSSPPPPPPIYPNTRWETCCRTSSRRLPPSTPSSWTPRSCWWMMCVSPAAVNTHRPREDARALLVPSVEGFPFGRATHSAHCCVRRAPPPVQKGNLLPFGSFGVNKRKGFKEATVCLFVFDVGAFVPWYAPFLCHCGYLRPWIAPCLC